MRKIFIDPKKIKDAECLNELVYREYFLTISTHITRLLRSKIRHGYGGTVPILLLPCHINPIPNKTKNLIRRELKLSGWKDVNFHSDGCIELVP